jgi:surfactin synthase thioesterase subunit
MTVSKDDEQDFLLLGLSFGGFLAQELSRIKKPKKQLLFSTIKPNLERSFMDRGVQY